MKKIRRAKTGSLNRVLLIFAILSLVLPFSSTILTYETVQGAGNPPEPFDVDPTTLQEIISKVTEQDVEKYITDLQNFGTRYIYSSQVNLSAQYIFDEFSNYSALSVENDYFDYNSYVVRNVIATLPGLNESNNKVYVVGGHYDSYASGSPMTNAPGADDDASGTAVSLEAAKILSQYRFDATIIFAAWTAEEVGLVGSEHWASNAFKNDLDIGAYLNFDMIGYDPDNKMGLDIGYNDPSIWISDEMVSINTDYSIGLNLTTGQGGTRSDHASFWAWDYHAVECIESEFNTPNYHSVNDTINKLNMEFDKKVTQLGIATLAKLAGVHTPGVGAIYLDSPAYQPVDTVEIKLYETDLNTNPGMVEQAIVEITSNTETIAETVILTETGSNTSVFIGTVNLATGAPVADGILQVTEGDKITVEYNDFDPAGIRKAEAIVDGTPPVISNVGATPDVCSAIITWNTDEPSDSRVYYGMSPSLWLEAYDSEMVTSHSIEVTGLEPSLFYYFDVESIDVAGNMRRDDNTSAHFNFRTKLGISVATRLGYVGYVKESDPSGNYFDEPDMLVGHGAQGIYHGAAQFNISSFPKDAIITDARVDFYGKRWHYTGSGGNWYLRMLENTIDSGWQLHGYDDIHDAVVEDTISPTMQDGDLSPRQWNTFTYGSGQYQALKTHLVNDTISLRLDGPQSGYYLFLWDTGNGDDSYGPEYSPRLIVAYETIGDTEGPVISNPQITPNPTYGATDVTLSAMITDNSTGSSNITGVRYYDPILNSWIAMDPLDGSFDSSTENIEEIIDISSWPDATYEIFIRAIDEAGNWGDAISVNLFKKPNFDLQLNFGWNLISIPLLPSDTRILKVLGSIAGDFDCIQYYDATDTKNHWKHNQSSKPSLLNDFDNIDHTIGFWIHITNASGALLQCQGSPLTENQLITLYPGWNLVGYPSQINKNRTEGLNNITFGQDINAIWSFNATIQEWEEMEESDYFEIGRGYWIHSKIEKTWEVAIY